MQTQPWYEIDVLSVGQGQRSGDAIAIKYSMVGGQWRVMVIDGGDRDSGARLVSHIRNHFATNIVNHVVNTHPDSDHCAGLSVVLEEMQVEELWMHLPWLHSPRMMAAFDDARLTPGGGVSLMRTRLRYSRTGRS